MEGIFGKFCEIGLDKLGDLAKMLILREHAARIEFDVDMKFLGCQKGRWVVEVLGTLTNRGLVRTKLNSFKFNLRGLKKDDSIEDTRGDNLGNILDFPHEIRRNQSWIPPPFEGDSFVESGVSQKYTYITWLPKDMNFIYLYGKFYYTDPAHGRGEWHTAAKAFKVPESQN